MGIKAAAFDYGKVISFPPDHGVMDELAAIGGVKREDLESLVWKFRGEYDRGLLNGQEYYRKILERLDVNPPDETLKKMAEIDMYSWKRVNPGTVKLMEELKKAGLLLGILSNMPHDFLAWARKTIPVFSLPHVGIFSCEALSIKPEEAIYRKLLSALGCRGEEVVFFDDVLENVNKARELKINAFLWKDPENARQELAGLGVQF
ncbi:MAG: HAD family phosphatase [Treponema sp.]|jgi:putative hydrolase of the HAD superfamily|nr:HAD family phosphatase [Treponema sp.]